MRIAAALVMLSLAFASAGCGKNASDMSRPSYLLDRLRQHWAMAKTDLQKEKPDYGIVGGLGADLSGQVTRMIEQEYTGQNKAELLKRLAALSAGYDSTISPMFAPTAHEIALRSGYTDAQLREAFAKLDVEYEAMIKLTQQ